MIRNWCILEIFLYWLHILVLMDDTILLSTSQSNVFRKVEVIEQFYREYNETVTNDKKKLFVINGEDGDKDTVNMNS